MLLISVLVASIIAVTTEQIQVSDEPLVLIENYFVNQQSLGIEHSRIRELRERIEEITKSDFQFDLQQVQKRFEKLTTDRRSLLRTRGLSHPDVIENATRLSLMARILAGQSAAVLRDISTKKQ